MNKNEEYNILDSNEYEIIMPSWADVVDRDRNLGISSPNIDSKNENNILTENSEDINESRDSIFKGTRNWSNEENNIETITEYDESKWIEEENSTGMVNRVQNIKYNIDNSVGLEESKIEFGHKTTHPNNYIPLTTKRKPAGTKNIYYTCLVIVLAKSIFLLTALKTSTLSDIMKRVQGDKIPPLMNEKILQNLGMIEGKKQLQSLFLAEYERFKYLGDIKAEVFSKIVENDNNFGIDSTPVSKELNVYYFEDYSNFASWALKDIKTGEVFEQIAPFSGLVSQMVEGREGQRRILKVLAKTGETAHDVVKRVGVGLGIYESNDIFGNKIKIKNDISNGDNTRVSDIFEATRLVSKKDISTYNWATRKYISRQVILITNELYKNGVVGPSIEIDEIRFNWFGEIRLEVGTHEIYNKNDEDQTNDFEDKFKDEVVCVGNILQKVLFENNEETISDEESRRWKELQNKCVQAKELKTYSLNDLINEFSDILGPLDN